jgi:fructuronate reductase
MSLPRLSAQLHLPGVARPAYDRAALRAGIAHLGLGAFHRCHQAEYTDDLLAQGETDWGIIGINIRPPALEPALGAQGGLYTRLMLDGERVTPRVIGSLLRVVDSQQSPLPALAVLADPAIHVVTLTVTEKGYCHHPSTGALNREHPDIAHDIAHPSDPRSLPGLLARALDLRRGDGSGRPAVRCAGAVDRRGLHIPRHNGRPHRPRRHPARPRLGGGPFGL